MKNEIQDRILCAATGLSSIHAKSLFPLLGDREIERAEA
jgi:hypothetical protein